jgi:DnaA-homolog protein
VTTAQLPLAIRWPAQQGFDDYLTGDNGAAVHLLRAAADEAHADWVFISGTTASGKTHLLIAACAAASEQGRRAQYISLALIPQDSAPADAIRALGGSDLLAIDDLDAIVGQASAEHALFDLYNRCKVEKSTLLFAARQPPAQAGLGLPDLVSRLSACAQAVLKPLDEDGRREVLIQRATARGLTLDAAVLDWLFVHHARDLRSLTELFERIDKAALAAQRRVTLPFLRGLLGTSN